MVFGWKADLFVVVRFIARSPNPRHPWNPRQSAILTIPDRQLLTAILSDH